MKYLTSVICLIISLTSTNAVQAQPLPSAQEVGNFFGNYMCKSLIEKGNIDDDQIMEKFAGDLIAKYGEETTLKLVEKMNFTEESMANDSYGTLLMKSAFSYVINNDPCFEIFLKQVF
ncbi:hypothetical protein [Geminocystis sp. GBBB08]|uniref:hypothetical protein n=1 Tax=Geminocystis sp. GBBB08 TaxID=2604140 RepID=UPI0027E2591A|nr:hypothetical protein [Geminocystis sp. GBBB08]MBL1210372.1 hypothetical protein [Geminocystis sp. GBBB08]